MIGTPHGYYRRRPAFFAVFFTDFFTAFLAGIFLVATFLAIFFAGVFLAAFFVTAFFAAFLTGGFLAVVLAVTRFAGAFFRTSETVVTAAPNAVLMAPATSDAIAIPIPDTIHTDANEVDVASKSCGKSIGETVSVSSQRYRQPCILPSVTTDRCQFRM
jgi:hypothetical protein